MQTAVGGPGKTHLLIIETATGDVSHCAFSEPEAASIVESEADYRQHLSKVFDETRAGHAQIKTLHVFGQKWVLIFVK